MVVKGIALWGSENLLHILRYLQKQGTGHVSLGCSKQLEDITLFFNDNKCVHLPPRYAAYCNNSPRDLRSTREGSTPCH